MMNRKLIKISGAESPTMAHALNFLLSHELCQKGFNLDLQAEYWQLSDTPANSLFSIIP